MPKADTAVAHAQIQEHAPPSINDLISDGTIDRNDWITSKIAHPTVFCCHLVINRGKIAL